MRRLRELDFDPGSFCPDRRDDIVTYVFQEMGPGASEAFEAHLQSCKACRREVDSMGETLRILAEASSHGAATPPTGDGGTWEEEWTLLRRRLLLGPSYLPEALPAADSGTARRWMARAAAVMLTAGLAFWAGYLWRGAGAPADGDRLPAQTHALPPVAGAAAGSYFDNLDDFTRDTHNFFRRTRMILMEFSNLGTDSDPTFFRASCAELLQEAGRYQDVAKRMRNRKLGDLLGQITGILTAISRVDPSSQKQVIGDVKTTLDLTGLIATLELLDAANERDLRGQPRA